MASAGSTCLSFSTSRPSDLKTAPPPLFGSFAAFRAALNLTSEVPTVSNDTPVRRARLSSAEMFSMLAPVASFRSLKPSIASTCARTMETSAPTVTPPSSPVANAPTFRKEARMRSAFCSASVAARPRSFSNWAIFAVRSIDRVASAISLPRRAGGF
jgi:hypothetical protein